MIQRITDEMAERLRAVFPEAVSLDVERSRLEVKGADVAEVLVFVRDELGLDYLAELTAADYLMLPKETPERYAVIYVVRSLQSGHELTVKAWVGGDEPEIDSATPLWKAADWLEREVFDMFGIVFRNHPNMIRILMPEDFDGHPLRKDFPPQGIGYRDDLRVVRRDDA